MVLLVKIHLARFLKSIEHYANVLFVFDLVVRGLTPEFVLKKIEFEK